MTANEFDAHEAKMIERLVFSQVITVPVSTNIAYPVKIS